MMHTYKPDQVATCLNHSRILYIGDSIARQQFFSFAKLIHPDIETDGEKHIDRKYEFTEEGLIFEFWWDPYLNDTRTTQFFQQPGSIDDIRPSLLVVGAGSWHMRYLEETNYMDQWQTSIDKVLDAVQLSSRLADAVIMSPMEIPQFDQLNPNRSATITPEKVKAMNDYLASQRSNIENAHTPFAIPFVWNKIISSSINVTQDGLHYDPIVTNAQVQLALNYRCNDVRPKHFPYDTTCCFHYPKPRWYQNIFFILFLILVPIGFYICDRLSRLVPSEKVLNALFIFGLGVIYMYFGDRTQLFGKIHKHYDSTTFTFLMTIFVVMAGLVTLQSNKKEGVDLGFLNRDQTDEWKGWMQVIILIYHFVGASGTSGIYNAVRILVAAYLFQTGYGHFFFFYKKADFGLARVLNVMVRLNFLTFVLQYLMDTDYLSYYFTPLVSFWFGIIYLTMYIGHSNNNNVKFMSAKIAIAAMVTTALINTPGVMEFVFDILRLLFNIQWNAQEWRFRLSLDGLIVYVGMISAFAYIKCVELKWMDHVSFGKIKKGVLISSAICLMWYFYFELTRENKFVYNHAQPYISWIPILAFVFLRNATVRLRNTSSRFFIFIGKISLETFIGQFHMWLAGDTKGLLVVIPNSAWVARSSIGWYTNLMVSTLLFVFVCYYISQTTGELTRWICTDLLMGTQQQRSHGNSREYQAVPLLPTSSTSPSSAPQSVIETTTTTGNNNTLEEQSQVKGKVNDNGDTNVVNVDEIEDDTGIPTAPSLGYRILSDPRFKVIVFLVGVGLLNRIS
ncbi:10 TM acyl transferase domain found in Cas1p-domain-containing protein [Halteromyces radiatus]|uniref:10 TM acyl transferase domain found in Cas1p-domain-containing protein n=1 Tax=Halteromyces radiatus TaxID=101107 RepID=UPI00221F65D7|nr:10 TM acyl transferase domain found in Cas1p-domain-containing protein [Halteromyces radiatus]KAI8097431.1 10 TM acyl transferase domain found in Cas1p-domain-containing protein [Halteromyces radiatus]